MDVNKFLNTIKTRLASSMVFNNPQRGTSTIVSVDNNKIVYRRGKSNIQLYFVDMIDALYQLSDEISTNDLKEFRPNVYDNKKNGHSCNCTFLFTLLSEYGYTQNGINGLGVKGNPYYVRLK